MNSKTNFALPDKAGGRGNVVRKTGSSKLYVSFYYFGKRIEKSTGLPDSAENRAQVRQWLTGVSDRIDAGTFRFAEAFPGASDQEKAYFASREGWAFRPEPQRILFSEYVERWLETIWAHYPSDGKRKDYRQAIDDWLLPYFGDKTFFQITRVEIQRFIAQLTWRSGKKRGQALSRSRVRNLFIPLRSIWIDACDEHHWDLPDPFRNLGKYFPRSIPKPVEVFRFEEWMAIIKNIEPYYRPVTEIMLMTGMIYSEIAGLRKNDLENDTIRVRNAIVRGVEKETLKTPFRQRNIPITEAVRERLEEVLARNTQGDAEQYVFVMKGGDHFRGDYFRDKIWTKALKKAALPYKKPYTLRHTFAAWALTLRMDPNKVVRLMGHGSKQMVYEVYGNYVEGLEQDAQNIADYFGAEFTGPKSNRHPLPGRKEWRKSSESRHLRVVK